MHARLLSPMGLMLTLTLAGGAAAQGMPAPAPSPATPATPVPIEPSVPAPAAAAVPVLETGLNRSELPGGVVVEDLKLGEGREFDATAVAYFARYRTLLKSGGGEVDSTARRTGEPTMFFVSQTVDGLTQGLMGMKMGGKRRVTVPSALAFGDKGVKDKAGKAIIPASADVIFEIELENLLSVREDIQGGGEEIKGDTRFQVFYRGTLVSDGTEFDGNIGKPTPATFSIDRLIGGWRAGLIGAKVGTKRRMVIPWQLGYGEAGNPPKIPAKADLIFDIEIIGLEPAPQMMPSLPGSPGSPIKVTPVPAPSFAPKGTPTPLPTPTPTPTPATPAPATPTPGTPK